MPVPLILLLAEDDAPLRGLLVGALRRDGYVVHEAGDGQQLLTIASALQCSPDLVISDVQMPFVTGPKAVAILRQGGMDSPVILITAFAGDDTRAMAVSLGDCELMEKPIDLGELRAHVRQRLKR